MSGHSDQTECPRCDGKNLMTYADYKPHDFVSGECLDCGLSYYTKDKRMSLKDVNGLRKERGFRPLKKLKKPVKVWLEYWGK